MPTPTIRSRVANAFRALRGKGYAARANYACCQTCAWSELPDEYPDAKGYFFYHEQDAERFDEKGNLPKGEKLYIAYDLNRQEHSTEAQQVEAGRILVAALEQAGLKVEWDGRAQTRVAVIGAKVKAKAASK